MNEDSNLVQGSEGLGLSLLLLLPAIALCVLFITGCSRKEPAGPDKANRGPAAAATAPSGAEPTPKAKQGNYCFRRKGNSARGASNKALEGVKLVEGNIRGLIVQKGDVKESQSKDNPSKKSYTVTYQLTNGSEISAIDEAGVHLDSDKILSVIVTQEGALPDDEVLGMSLSEGAMALPVFMARTSAGGLVVRINGKAKTRRRTSAAALLGEYRLDPVAMKPRVIPHLEVSTLSGTVTIPVQDMVTFREIAK